MSEGVFLSTKQAGATLPPHVNIFPSGLVIIIRPEMGLQPPQSLSSDLFTNGNEKQTVVII